MNSLEDPKQLIRQQINENFTWPKQLCTPYELVDALKRKTRLRIVKSPICSKLVLQIVGSWAYLLANVLNRSKIFNYEVFHKELHRIERQVRDETGTPQADKQWQSDANIRKSPLLTFSNHISCIDDPILWASLFPSLTYYSSQTDSVRWTAAAVDICFARPWHSTFFALGKTFPIMRGVGVDQPAMDFACALLNHNHWLHLFPEGRVMRDENRRKISNVERGYVFKWGISKLILDYFKKTEARVRDKTMRILPFYHLGLDDILPIGWPYLTRCNKRITILIRPQVIEMNNTLLTSILSNRQLNYLSAGKSWSNDEVLRIKLTNYLEEEMEKLIEPATRLHFEGNNNSV